MRRIENRVLADHVYDAIKRMIDEGALTPGSKVNKRDLEETLGVSQTPINEALNRLTGEKYLCQENRRGYFVEFYSDTALGDLFAVRAAVEGIAARLCAEEATKEELAELCSFFDEFTTPITPDKVPHYQEVDTAFHRAIIHFSHNEAIQNLSNNHGYITKTVQRGLVRSPEATLGEHQGIRDALSRRDGDAAQHLMTEHHLKSRTYLKSLPPAKEPAQK